MTKRSYDAAGRRAAAQGRRDRVADIAAAMFAERGWGGTTVAAVADRAGVSVELVAKAFGGKPGLFMAAFRRASFEGGVDLPTAFADLRLDLEPDLELRLDRLVSFACTALQPMAPLVPVMTAGAEQDDELRRLVDAAKEGHAATSREVVRLLASGPVGADAVDEVYVLTLAETYLAFVQQRGWTVERYAAWLRRSLRTALRPG
ncbi:TetR/AcrR family transcriptional regulator [Nocardioides mangrovi]|uniref:TetR/AcrR family transcriptional regulator helix-turn-helix transcriptional regulator n=1 Tax=Nocardioides mangrovi TaxID=2874580 RepID=A0ABS7UA25_9ACTN|nr:TetR/AcrR family transcriptional regulator [Nocardioides mangrovi]MBZ5737548.1 TetR/AcrR family transcriptional regulator; helix-turn-helix transcriptional regulator [Nocardioides mangrovi]